jgi:hypothetical protein
MKLKKKIKKKKFFFFQDARWNLWPEFNNEYINGHFDPQYARREWIHEPLNKGLYF